MTIRIGLALEGLLADVQAHFVNRYEGQASSYLDPNVVRDETFWATVPPTENMTEFARVWNFAQEIYESATGKGEELIVLTERPVSLLLITRSWLRRNGLKLPDRNIRFGSIGPLKRYDCRLFKVDYFYDMDSETINSFKYDYACPVGIGNGFETWVNCYPNLKDAYLNWEPDKREWNLWKNES